MKIINVSALHPVEENAHWVLNYKKFEDGLSFTGISFPVKLNDIPQFEKLNGLCYQSATYWRIWEIPLYLDQEFRSVTIIWK